MLSKTEPVNPGRKGGGGGGVEVGIQRVKLRRWRRVKEKTRHWDVVGRKEIRNKRSSGENVQSRFKIRRKRQNCSDKGKIRRMIREKLN